MSILRAAGKAFLFLACAALALDGMRLIATPRDGLVLTSLAMYLDAYAPQARETLQSFFLASAPGFVWTNLVEPLLILPVSLVAGGLGVLLFMAGYRPPAPEIVRE
jgi:hypothetical protein